MHQQGYIDIQRMGVIEGSGVKWLAYPNEEQDQFLRRINSSLTRIVNEGGFLYQEMWYTNELIIHALGQSMPLVRRFFSKPPIISFYLYNKYQGLRKLIKSRDGWAGLSFDDEVITEGTLIAAFAEEFGFLDGDQIHMGHIGDDHVVLADSLGYGSLEDALRDGLVRYIVHQAGVQLELVPSKKAKTTAINFLKKEKPGAVQIDWITKSGDPIWSEKSANASEAILHIMRFGDA